MEVGTHVWLRSDSSQWGWVPAVISKKESLVSGDLPKIRLTFDHENVRLDENGGVDGFGFGGVGETDDGDDSNGYGNYDNNDDVGRTVLTWDPEKLRGVDHEDVKLRNDDASCENAIPLQRSTSLTSSTSVSSSNLSNLSTPPVGGVDDLIHLTHLHEPAILHALRQRYSADVIYTFTGPILIAVNPFKSMPDLYGEHVMERYRNSKGRKQSQLAPHVYATADDAYRTMRRALEDHRHSNVNNNNNNGNSNNNNGNNNPSNPKRLSTSLRAKADQSILVSGESGAGKTVTTKIVLNYFVMLSRRITSPRDGHSQLESHDDFRKEETIISPHSTSTGYLAKQSPSERSQRSCPVFPSAPMVSSSSTSYSSTTSVSFRSRSCSSRGDEKTDVGIEQRALQSNPILESFGNARTIRNDNSSRFGKYIDVRFDARGKLSGASIETYLLEKVRLIHPGYGERNYHIFYQFLEAATHAQRRELYLHTKTKHEFKFLSQTETFDRRDGVSDRETYHEMLEAMITIGFDASEIHSLMRLVVAILFAGNLSFETVEKAHHESCYLEKDEASMAMANLLGVTFDDLASSLTCHKIDAGGERVDKLLDRQQATKGKEALVKALYGAMFAFLVDHINASIVGETTTNTTNTATNATLNENSSLHTASTSTFTATTAATPCRQGVASIGVLDIFGFETFQVNSFEQMCINYTNEALQQQFNKVVFKLEQREYEREGILWKFIQFPDNQDVLDLIDQKHTGILAILDEQCRVPQSGDDKFCRVLYHKCDASPRFLATSTQRVNRRFSIEHYAGHVEYSTENWIEKNKDELPKSSADLLSQSSFEFLSRTLRPYLDLTADHTLNHSHHGHSHNNHHNNQSHWGSNSVNSNHSNFMGGKGKRSVGAQFSQQLRSLRQRIDTTTPHYIRCLKPNDYLKPNTFQPRNVVEQLRCGGVLEAVRVSRAGYPTRYPHSIFSSRYGVLRQESIRQQQSYNQQQQQQQDASKRSSYHSVSDDVSVCSSWTQFGAKESRLKDLVSRIAYMVWEEELMIRQKQRNQENKLSSGHRQRQRQPRPVKKRKPKEDHPTSQAFPESREEFLCLDFFSRCAVAGLQLGKTKVFLRREAFERIEAMRSHKYFCAAKRIQQSVRGYVGRSRYRRYRNASVAVQSMVRMALQRKKWRALCRWRAATKIQSVYRMSVERYRVWGCYLQLKRAATMIQQWWRFTVHRRRFGESGAVVRIQAWFRGMLARSQISVVLYSIVQLQAWSRGVAVRRRIELGNPSKVEAFVRGRLEEVASQSVQNIQHLNHNNNPSQNSLSHSDDMVSPTTKTRRADASPFVMADPRVPPSKTKLYKAIEEQEWATVEQLLDRNPQLAEQVEPSSGELPLHVISRQVGAWSLLVDMILVLYPKALIHRDRRGALPIHHAAAHDNVAALEIIHSAYKEGIHEVDYEGRLAIHVAAEYDALDATKFLLGQAPEGAYTMIHRPSPTTAGGLPLHVACRHHASIGVITAFLAENFASAKRADENGDLPLHLLLRCGAHVDPVVVKTLLTCFAGSVSRTDMNGDLPLFLALQHRCRPPIVTTLLLQYPAAATIRNGAGHTCLHVALSHRAEDRTVLNLLNHAPELATTVDTTTKQLPIQVATEHDASFFLVHHLLKKDMPIDLKEKVRAHLLPHNYSWNHLIGHTADLYHPVVHKLLQQCTQPQVLALAHVEGADGRIALASATPVCKHELRVMLRLFNTLEVINQRPAYVNPVSDTQIFYALRYDPPPMPSGNHHYTVLHEESLPPLSHNDVDEWDDHSHSLSLSRNNTNNNNNLNVSGTASIRSERSRASAKSVREKLSLIQREKGQQVIAKLTSRADVVERELKVRKDFHLSRHYVPAILSVHHTVQHAAYSEAMAEPGYCITMEGADTTAENLILDLRKSGRSFPVKALKRIGISLLHMHEHGVVHCDFGTHNIGKFGSRWKLLGVGGSVPVGQATNPRRGFYHPPESVSSSSTSSSTSSSSSFLHRRHPSHPSSSNDSASVQSIPAQATYDIWAYGVVLYETIAGLPLGPYACRGKRDLSAAEIAKIGKWDDHSLRKALKLIPTSSTSKDHHKNSTSNHSEKEGDNHNTLAQARDLLQKLLVGDPHQRIQSMRQVLDHPYFSSDKPSKSNNTHSHSHHSNNPSTNGPTDDPANGAHSRHPSGGDRDQRTVTSRSSRHSKSSHRQRDRHHRSRQAQAQSQAQSQSQSQPSQSQSHSHQPPQHRDAPQDQPLKGGGPHSHSLDVENRLNGVSHPTTTKDTSTTDPTTTTTGSLSGKVSFPGLRGMRTRRRPTGMI